MSILCLLNGQLEQLSQAQNRYPLDTCLIQKYHQINIKMFVRLTNTYTSEYIIYGHPADYGATRNQYLISYTLSKMLYLQSAKSDSNGIQYQVLN